ncbi:hypothetical protein BDC45DRAFT_314413 [Circinella umbellata]|nr:hypothetical protein BDC45DRAFT_314413 [Circinella umbellata]
MSNFDHKKWVREQMLKPNNASSVYDYLDFARQVDSTKALTNMYFGNALTYGEKIDKYHQKYISKARKKMTQVNNNESPFGLEYQKYWEGAGQQRINKRKLKTAEKLTDITADLMETIAEDIGNCARKRHHAISSSLVSTSTSNVSSSSSSLPSTSKSSTKHSTSSISLNLRSQVQPLMELVNKFDTSLKNFKIIDFVETGVFELFKHSLDHELFEKLNKPVDQTWAPDEHCAKLLNSISQADPEREDLIVAVRTPVIDPISYRPYKHRDLRAIEIITGNW